MRGACLFLLAAVNAALAERVPVEITTREIFAFPAGGMIEIKDSFGEIEIEGWDQPDVEVTAVRTTRKKYAPEEREKALAELEKILVSPQKTEDQRFLITTEFPARPLLKRTFGRPNIRLIYRIRVPSRSNLLIKHDVGEVVVKRVAGNIDITNRIGQVSLTVPDEAVYQVDARSGKGGVRSEITPIAGRPVLVSAAPADVRMLYLRVDVGAINIRKHRDAGMMYY